MKPLILSLAVASLLFSRALLAGDTYQVTGTVTAVDDKKITVQKSGKENFEMALGAGATVPAEVKVGSKVTAYYTITATKIESKEKPAAPAKAAKPAKAATTPAKTS